MIVLIVNMVYMAKNLVATYLTAAATTTTTTMLKNADTIINVKRGVGVVGMIVLIVNMVYMAKNLVATYLTANEEVGHEGTHAL